MSDQKVVNALPFVGGGDFEIRNLRNWR